MALPRSKEARRFYRAGKQRFEDARFLLEAERPTAAIYLGGYSVECILKALLLTLVPDVQAQEVLETFRGAKAHEYNWLKARCLQHGPPFSSQLNKDLSLADSIWEVAIRYDASTARNRDAQDFLNAVESIVRAIDERI